MSSAVRQFDGVGMEHDYRPVTIRCTVSDGVNVLCALDKYFKDAIDTAAHYGPDSVKFQREVIGPELAQAYGSVALALIDANASEEVRHELSYKGMFEIEAVFRSAGERVLALGNRRLALAEAVVSLESFRDAAYSALRTVAWAYRNERERPQRLQLEAALRAVAATLVGQVGMRHSGAVASVLACLSAERCYCAKCRGA